MVSSYPVQFDVDYPSKPLNRLMGVPRNDRQQHYAAGATAPGSMLTPGTKRGRRYAPRLSPGADAETGRLANRSIQRARGSGRR